MSAVRRARRGARPTCSDTFLDSAWYFLRYPSVGPRRRAVRSGAHEEVAAGELVHRRQRARRAAPAVLALRHDGAARRGTSSTSRSRSRGSARTGMIIREGAKMSKSSGNVVNPDEYIERVGRRRVPHLPHVPRPVRGGRRFRDQGISGVRRFLDRLWASVHDARRDGAPDADGDAQAAPDDQEGRRRHPAARATTRRSRR